MTGLLRIIIFFLLFLIVIRLIRVFKRFWSSSKETANFVKRNGPKKKQQFKDVEDAEFREIPSDKKNESKENKN